VTPRQALAGRRTRPRRPGRAGQPARPGQRLGAGFTVYWLTQSVSLFGDAFAFIAFPLLVLQATGSVAQMGRVTATISISMVAAGVAAGPVADRFPPRVVILACDGLRAVVNLVLAACWAAWPRLGLLYAAVALAGAASAFFQAAHSAMLIRLVDRSQLTRANGLYQLSAGIAFMAGPSVGGAVAAAFGPVTAVGINGLSFAAAALGMLVLWPRARHQETPSACPLPVGGDGRDVGPLAGAAYVWRRPVLRRLLVLTALAMTLTFGLIDLSIYHLRHDLGHSAAAVGVLITVAATGAIAAAVTAGALRRRLGFTACWTGSCITAGAATAAVSVISSVPGLLLAGVAFTFATTLAVVCASALRLELTPGHLTGRVAAAFGTAQLIALAAGAVGVTAAAGAFGARAVFAVAGAALALVGIVSLAVRVGTPA
jgi:MFS family permease